MGVVQKEWSKDSLGFFSTSVTFYSSAMVFFIVYLSYENILTSISKKTKLIFVKRTSTVQIFLQWGVNIQI